MVDGKWSTIMEFSTIMDFTIMEFDCIKWTYVPKESKLSLSDNLLALGCLINENTFSVFGDFDSRETIPVPLPRKSHYLLVC